MFQAHCKNHSEHHAGVFCCTRNVLLPNAVPRYFHGAFSRFRGYIVQCLIAPKFVKRFVREPFVNIRTPTAAVKFRRSAAIVDIFFAFYFGIQNREREHSSRLQV